MKWSASVVLSRTLEGDQAKTAERNYKWASSTERSTEIPFDNIVAPKFYGTLLSRDVQDLVRQGHPASASEP